uniref:Uncharacterized protein n=1 Tax=Solanum lycopersicum TaxID=4081 RepID=A0A3Q7JD37_SOLLC
MLRQKQNRKKYLLDQRLGVLFRVKTSGPRPGITSLPTNKNWKKFSSGYTCTYTFNTSF